MLHFLPYLILYSIYLAIFFLFLNHVVIFGYLYIQHNLGHLENPTDFPAVPLWRYLKNFCLELLYMSSKFFLFLYKFIDLTYIPSVRPLDKNKIAILLVHGYTRSPADWLWFRRQLYSLQYPIYTVQLRPTYGAIEKLAYDCLRTKIAEIKQQTNCEQVIIVAHSMGGLVSSYYSENFDEANLVRTVISIVTPFHGTSMSASARGDNAKEMCPNSQFTKDLRGKINKSHKQYYQIATILDNLVYPWRSALLENTPISRQLVLPYEAHLATLYSKTVVNKVKEWIKGV